MASRSFKSSAPSVSFRSNILGSLANARARPTRFHYPPDSSDGLRFAMVTKRTNSNSSCALRSQLVLSCLLIINPYATFSNTLMCGNSA